MADSKTTDIELAAPNDAITGIAFHPTDPNRLLSASWDASVRLYNCADPGDVKNYIPSRAPVFDVTWGPASSSKIYSGGLDRSVVETDLETSTYRVIANHNDAVKCVKYLESANCLVSASWDSTLKLHDPRSSTPANPSSSVTLPIPAKAFSMDSAGDKLVLAMAQRHVLIYDHRNLSSAVQSLPSAASVEPFQKRENSLKFMTRSVKCMPNGNGYASSSIEGRVAVEYYDQDPTVQKGHFAFKCHRATVDGVDTVYPVNALAFNPSNGLMATGGGDGVVAIWDTTVKKRRRQLPKFGMSVASLAYNCDGTRLAVACSAIEEEQPMTDPAAKPARLVVTAP